MWKQGRRDEDGHLRPGSAAQVAQFGINAESLPSKWDCSVKRQLDCSISFAVLLLAAPFLLLIALVIAIGYGRPIFIAHMRIGRNGTKFPCLKFRTMVVDAQETLARHLEANPEAREEWEATRKLRNDPRITPIGRFLRKSSLDELPQLINVLRGDMSLVGPRPIVTEEMPLYGPWLKDYLSVRPGMTGPWQVSGRNDVSYRERVQLDSQYARNWSLAGDFVLMLRTLIVVMKTKGSY